MISHRWFGHRGIIPQDAGFTREEERTRGQVIPWVFHRYGRPIRNVRKIWKNVVTAAGLTGKIPHDFRRTAVRNLERAGVPRSVAMKLVGHKTESVYRRYAIVAVADLREGVEKLAALHGRIGGESVRKVVAIAQGQ